MGKLSVRRAGWTEVVSTPDPHQPPMIQTGPDPTTFEPGEVAKLHAQNEAERRMKNWIEVANEDVPDDVRTWMLLGADEIVALIRDGLLYRQAKATEESR